MNDQRPFQTFIIRAHRRRFALRMIEHATLGLLVSSCLGAIILTLAWWRSIDAIGPISAVLLIGVAAGVIASTWRRPTLLATAGLIETQLHAPELITSAMLVPPSDFAQALHAMADARVAGVTLTSLVLRRFGSRTFIGAGLASACVLVISIMTTAPVAERWAIASDSSNPVDRWIEERVPPKLETVAPDASEPSRPIQRDPDSPDASRSADSLSTRADQSHNGSGTAANTSGGGAGRSDEMIVRSPESNRRRATGVEAGTIAAGGNGNATNVLSNGTIATGIVSDTPSVAPIAPWQSSRWALDRDTAMQAIGNGSVPDLYRSLVADYFDRR